MINIDILNNIGIDYSEGLERFMFDQELYEAVLSAFVESDAYDKSIKAYKDNNIENLMYVVHEVKGSSGNAGLYKLYVESCMLMNLLRSPSYTEDEYIDCYNKYIVEYEKVYKGIKKALL